MRLDALTIELRPRSSWEAMELGGALVRRHAAAVWAPWLLFTLPVFALLNLAAWSIGRVELALLAMWWLRPVFDRIPIYVLSRAVFGATPTVRETLTAQLHWGWRTMFGHLTWRRLSPFRAGMLPIDLLEGADDRLRQERRRVIGEGISGHAVQLTAACSAFVLIVELSILMLVLLFVPNEQLPDFGRSLWRLVSADMPQWLMLVVNIVDYLAVSLIEPLFVAGGFGLYLNRRTQLEAWDVEIAFRRLRRRLESASTALLGAVLLPLTLLLATTGDVHAQARTEPQAVSEFASEADADPTASDRAVSDAVDGETAAGDTTMDTADGTTADGAAVEGATDEGATADGATDDAEEDTGPPHVSDLFGDDTVDTRAFDDATRRAYADERLRPKRTDWTWESTSESDEAPWLVQVIAQIVAFFLKHALVIALLVALVFLLVTLGRWLPWLKGVHVPRAAAPSPVDSVPIPRDEPLPPDIVGTARALWREGQPRRALALVYRAAVVAMTARLKTHLPPGATEAECLRLSRRLSDPDERGAFQRMVLMWQYAAYGQRLPEEADFDGMLAELAARFGWSS